MNNNKKPKKIENYNLNNFVFDATKTSRIPIT
jgi:hypothetical protein